MEGECFNRYKATRSIVILIFHRCFKCRNINLFHLQQRLHDLKVLHELLDFFKFLVCQKLPLKAVHPRENHGAATEFRQWKTLLAEPTG